MKRILPAALFAVAFCTLSSPAYADLTAFVGVTPTPDTRLVRGFAGGLGLVIVGFEFEYADTLEDKEVDAPSLRTGMGNVYLQTPVAIHGMKFYGTVGGGAYRERLRSREETNFGTNIGGGVKVSLLGPVKLRLDYRLFSLKGDALHSRPQRLYAGLNLSF